MTRGRRSQAADSPHQAHALAGSSGSVGSTGQASARQLTLRRLAVALITAVLVSTLFVPADSISVSQGETLPQVLAILLGSLLALAGGVSLWSWTSGRRAALGLFVLAVTWLLLSTLWSAGQADGRAAWNSFWHLLALMLLALLTQRFAAESSVARAWWQLLLLCALFQAVYGVHQYFVSLPAARAEYLRDPDLAIAQAGIDAPPGSELRMQYESRLLGSSEPIGTFALANSLAVQLSGGLLALWLAQVGRHLALAPPVKKSTSGFALAVLWLAWLLIGIAWLLTKSRTAYLAVLVTMLPALYWLWHVRTLHRSSTNLNETVPAPRATRRQGWAILMGLFLVGCVLLGGLIGLLASDQLVLSEAPKSIAFRLEYWQASARMILDYPLTGVGLGNFQSFYPRYKLPTASEIVADPHNWIFDIAASCSIVVLAAALAALGLAARIWWRLLGEDIDEETIAQAKRPELPDAHDPQRWTRAVWSGAAVGLAVTVGLQLILQEMVDLQATLISLVVCCPVLWALRTTQFPLRLLRYTALAAALVILLTLLATGSWQASGIAMPWCMWLSISLMSGRQERDVSLAASARVPYQLLVGLTLLAAFYLQTWQPVHTSWSHAQVASNLWQQGDLERAEQAARQAIAADNAGTHGPTLLVQIMVNAAQRAAEVGDPGQFQREVEKLPESLARMIDSDRASYLTWSLAGESWLTIASAAAGLRQDTWRNSVIESVEHYQQALERYPSSVALHAQLAAALAILIESHSTPGAAESVASLRQALEHALEEAFSLSSATVHLNRQLPSQQVWLPEPLANAFPSQAIVRPVPGAPWAKAEPLCNFMRSKYAHQK